MEQFVERWVELRIFELMVENQKEKAVEGEDGSETVVVVVVGVGRGRVVGDNDAITKASSKVFCESQRSRTYSQNVCRQVLKDKLCSS